MEPWISNAIFHASRFGIYSVTSVDKKKEFKDFMSTEGTDGEP
jgi:hypothetical protein